MTNNPWHRVYFVDLSPDPSIKRRVVESSARDVASIGLGRSRPNTARCVPDDTGYRYWIYAADSNEALWEAHERLGE